MSEPVMGRWHKMKMRCEKCGRVRDEVYVVSDPPVTGKFCSAFCYQAARKEVENGKPDKEV